MPKYNARWTKESGGGDGDYVVPIGVGSDIGDDISSIAPMERAMRRAGLSSTQTRYAYWGWVNRHKLVQEFARRA